VRKYVGTRNLHDVFTISAGWSKQTISFNKILMYYYISIIMFHTNLIKTGKIIFILPMV